MDKLPEYPWFDKAPPHLRTRKQLAAEGLVPTGQPVALVVWRGGRRTAQLYDPAQTRPKNPPTPAQLAALEKARAATEAKRWTCGACGLVVVGGLDEDGICDSCVHKEHEAFLEEYRQRSARWARKMLRKAESDEVRILDLETTGLDSPGIVQIGVVAGDGRVLLDTFVHPDKPITDGALAVHRITPAMVATAPPLSQLLEQLQETIAGKTVIVYNLRFDYGVLHSCLVRLWTPPPEQLAIPLDESQLERYRRHQALHDRATAWLEQATWVDAMEPYAAAVGDWSERRGDFRWQPLPGARHSAIDDCRAVLDIIKTMAKAYKKREVQE
jgi:hypothetical protein